MTAPDQDLVEKAERVAARALENWREDLRHQTTPEMAIKIQAEHVIADLAAANMLKRPGDQVVRWRPIEEALIKGKKVDLLGTYKNLDGLLVPVRVTDAEWLPHDLFGGPLCEEMWTWPGMKDEEHYRYTFTHFMLLPEPLQ